MKFLLKLSMKIKVTKSSTESSISSQILKFWFQMISYVNLNTHPRGNKQTEKNNSIHYVLEHRGVLETQVLKLRQNGNNWILKKTKNINSTPVFTIRINFYSRDRFVFE